MDFIFKQTVTVETSDCDEYGSFRLSALLHYAQEAAGGHCETLGLDWDSMAEKGLFWAVLRHRVVIDRLPKAGETVHLQTWPMPSTRVAYPRAVRAMDEAGNKLFDVVSLWVLMDIQSRAMVLPAKGGVGVPGIVLGDEPDGPGTLVPGNYCNNLMWVVSPRDLDINNHVNNAKYLDHAETLAGDFRRTHTPKELTVCYLAEVRLGQEINLSWELSDNAVLAVEGTRIKADDPQKTERVFAARVFY